MPIHEYKCKKCACRIEVLQKLNDKPLQKCQKCGGSLEKLISSSAIQFKGSGFYITDYAHKNIPSTEAKSREKAPKDKPDASKDTAKKDAPATPAG